MPLDRLGHSYHVGTNILVHCWVTKLTARAGSDEHSGGTSLSLVSEALVRIVEGETPAPTITQHARHTNGGAFMLGDCLIGGSFISFLAVIGRFSHDKSCTLPITWELFSTPYHSGDRGAAATSCDVGAHARGIHIPGSTDRQARCPVAGYPTPTCSDLPIAVTVSHFRH